MAEPTVYKIRYARHVLSESNAGDNSGVDLHDPVLTTAEREEDWIKDKKLEEAKRGTGRKWAEGKMRGQFLQHEKKSRVFMVSPLTRAIQTFLLSVTEQELRGSRIIVEPLLIEQTLWFSDRARAVTKIQDMIEHELEYRFNGRLKMNDLNIIWDRMIPSETKDNERLDRPWHLKTNGWAPENLLERGRLAVQVILQECKNFESYTGRSYTDYDICVFGHGGFVNYMTDKIGTVDVKLKVPRLTDWKTGEVREFKIYDYYTCCSLMVEEKDLPLTSQEAAVVNTKRRDLKDFITNMVHYNPEQELEFKKGLNA
ncbi:hypothetical protein PFICI_05226 [Pestalotiopsis fici W106-1]|uniref:Uncharacterized protein n=1 Tax=Pestalotiopsis fici (strain W106-1 / CGMCC3.15140) TaxID=1229662 RepID=W3XBD2_PESFW|nr:uncharacterized protein PFICI_05226 [Pestalotiopsis fici W106-1]ETS83350.1 hypothetical protein PFICI_05226 [Pestalotiopsis fici W106-1]